MIKWKEVNLSHSSNYYIDKMFRRVLFKFGPFKIFESIRIVQYKSNDDPRFIFIRGVTLKEYNFIQNYFIIDRILITYQKILGFFFNKEVKVDDVRKSKYVYKYQFVGDLFKEVTRNKKLEQLGI